MKWYELATYVLPTLGLVVPGALEIVGPMARAVMKAQSEYNDTDDTREQPAPSWRSCKRFSRSSTRST
jgi:hypothetical protein